jgi:hypothetical protein
MFEKRISAKERMRNNLVKKLAEQDAVGWGESHPKTGDKLKIDNKTYTVRRDGSYVRSKKGEQPTETL